MFKKMSDNVDRTSQILVGWENKLDVRGRRQYFYDGNSIMPVRDDGRPRYKSLFYQNHPETSYSFRQEGSTIRQHGSLEFYGCNLIHPSNSSYPSLQQLAFQFPPTPYSHLEPISLQQQETTYNCRPSPLLNRGGGTVMGANAYQHKTPCMDTFLSENTDELVSKIGATFPTVSETHIRCLLKKYHNREAVVMSALQVEKHPIATPGPFSVSSLVRNSNVPGIYTPQMTPPVSIRGTSSISIRRNMSTPPITVYGSMGTPPLGIWGTPLTRGGSPVLRASSGSSYYSSPAFGDYKQSPKSQGSPKMKLRYLKSIFPKVDETVLFDVLASESNNVSKTADKLKILGFEKKEINSLKTSGKKQQDELRSIIQKGVENHSPTPPPRMKSLEEKNKMITRLSGLYEEMPERLIQMAIESVNFDEEKARHLLMLMVNEEKENKRDVNQQRSTTLETNSSYQTPKEKKESASKESQIGKKSDEKKTKTRRDVPKVSRGTSTTEDKEFKSPYLTKATGRNRDLRKGPNDQLLLSDYLTWNGPNPEITAGQDKCLVKGPNTNLLSEKKSIAQGPNKKNLKGPLLGLAKGSIYSRITMALKG